LLCPAGNEMDYTAGKMVCQGFFATFLKKVYSTCYLTLFRQELLGKQPWLGVENRDEVC